MSDSFNIQEVLGIYRRERKKRWRAEREEEGDQERDLRLRAEGIVTLAFSEANDRTTNMGDIAVLEIHPSSSENIITLILAEQVGGHYKEVSEPNREELEQRLFPPLAQTLGVNIAPIFSLPKRFR